MSRGPARREAAELVLDATYFESAPRRRTVGAVVGIGRGDPVGRLQRAPERGILAAQALIFGLQ